MISPFPRLSSLHPLLLPSSPKFGVLPPCAPRLLPIPPCTWPFHVANAFFSHRLFAYPILFDSVCLNTSIIAVLRVPSSVSQLRVSPFHRALCVSPCVCLLVCVSLYVSPCIFCSMSLFLLCLVSFFLCTCIMPLSSPDACPLLVDS